MESVILALVIYLVISLVTWCLNYRKNTYKNNYLVYVASNVKVVNKEIKSNSFDNIPVSDYYIEIEKDGESIYLEVSPSWWFILNIGTTVNITYTDKGTVTNIEAVKFNDLKEVAE